MVTEKILVQQTTTQKQPPLEKLLEDLIHKQAIRRYWYEMLTAIHHVAAKEVERQMGQAKAEIRLHKRRQSKKSVEDQGPGDPASLFYGFDDNIWVCCVFFDTATVKLLRGK